jgi:hypothetical protein
MKDENFHRMVTLVKAAMSSLEAERRRRFKVGMTVAINDDNYRGLGVIDGFPKQVEKMLVKVHGKKSLVFGCESIFSINGSAE